MPHPFSLVPLIGAVVLAAGSSFAGAPPAGLALQSRLSSLGPSLQSPLLQSPLLLGPPRQVPSFGVPSSWGPSPGVCPRGQQQSPAPTEEPDPVAAPLRSLLTAPVSLGSEPPPCRTLELIHLPVPADAGPEARAEVLALAARLRAQATDADAFRALAVEHSAAPNAGFGGVLGTFPEGVLDSRFERFLWSAEPGAVSAPLERDDAVLLLRRGERWAGCRWILLRGLAEPGSDRGEAARLAEARRLLARLEAGEDFADLARAHSEDAASAERGGALRVFERGPQDRLLKKELFEAAIGEVVGPLVTPLGVAIAQRIPHEELPPELWESGWARVRAILVSHEQAPGGIELNARPFAEALALAEELRRRIADEGEDMAALAAEFDDDVDGRLRRGDLGWIRRGSPATRGIVTRVFQAQPGTLLGPLPLPIGYLLLRREDV